MTGNTQKDHRVPLEGLVRRRERTYEERAEYACDVCGNVPDNDGVIQHGKGCYTQSADGGGESFVEFDK